MYHDRNHSGPGDGVSFWSACFLTEGRFFDAQSYNRTTHPPPPESEPTIVDQRTERASDASVVPR